VTGLAAPGTALMKAQWFRCASGTVYAVQLRYRGRCYQYYYADGMVFLSYLLYPVHCAMNRPADIGPTVLMAQILYLNPGTLYKVRVWLLQCFYLNVCTLLKLQTSLHATFGTAMRTAQ
jgi:hypothetical protein